MRWWKLLLLFAGVSLLTRGPFLFFDIVNVDEAAHAVGSWELLRGGRLYLDFADHKPPLLYVYYALVQALFGRGMPAVRAFTALVTLPLTALAAAAFFRHDARGLAAGLLYLVYGAAFLAHDVQAVHAEVLMLLPAAWALVPLRERETAGRARPAALAGALLGTAVLFKQQSAFWLPALVLAALAAAAGTAARVRAAAALLIGFTAPLAVSLAVFAAQGTLDHFVYWNVTHNLPYATHPLPLREALTRAASYLLPFLLVTAPLWWAAGRSRALLDSHRRRLVAAVLALSVPPAFLGLRFFPHYFIQLYLPLALAAAPCAAALARRPLGRPARVALAWSAFVLLGFTAANLLLYTRLQAYEETRPTFRRVAQRLRADPCHAGANLFVWGFAPGFYYHSALPPATRFVIPATTISGYVAGNRSLDWTQAQALIREDHWRWLLDDLQTRPATYILDTAPSGLHRWRNHPLDRYPHLWTLVQREYELIDVVDGVGIHRRKGCQIPSHPGAS